MKIYSLHDRVAQEFAYPFVANNSDVAIRSAKQALSKAGPDAQADHDLYLLGEMDMTTGKITGEVEPLQIKASLVSFPFVPQVSPKGGKK